MVANKLDQKLKAKYNMGLYEILGAAISNSYQSRDVVMNQYQQATESVMYTIDFNGMPLFKINDTLLTEAKNDPNYLNKPLETIKKYLSKKLSTNYNTFLNDFSNGLTNISKSYEVTPNTKTLTIKKEAITNYGNSNIKNIDFNNSTNPSNGINRNLKLFDENIYTKYGVSQNDLHEQLLRCSDDEQSLLKNSNGTLEAIFQYNKELNKLLAKSDLTQAQKNQINKNAITNPNDVVVLYDKDKTMTDIKYGEHLTYDYKFNESLSNGNTRVISSIEERNMEFQLDGISLPSKVYKFLDYNGNVILEQTINSINGSYELGEKQAYDNALKQIKLPTSSNVVYFVDKFTSQKKLVENTYTNLYVLKKM